MNETLDRIIKQSGEMWAAIRDRTTSPVLVKLDDATTGQVFELTLPLGEGHPFWRINERELTTEETACLSSARIHGLRQRHAGWMWKVGSLDPLDVTHSMQYETLRVRGYIYNGRKGDEWQMSAENVRVTIESLPTRSHPEIAPRASLSAGIGMLGKD